MTTSAADAPTDTEATDAPTDDTTETTDTSTATTEESQSADTDDDAAKWKSLARKHESEKKRLARELEQLKAAQMTEQEKALAEAEQRGAKTAQQRLGERLARAELKAAGVPAEVIDELNLSRYVTEDGDVDDDAVAQTAAKFSSIAKPSAPRVPTGPQNGGSKSQLTRDDLKHMSAEEIVKADEEGRLAALYSGRS